MMAAVLLHTFLKTEFKENKTLLAYHRYSNLCWQEQAEGWWVTLQMIEFKSITYRQAFLTFQFH